MKSNSVINHTLKKTYPSKAVADKVVAFLATKFIYVRSYKCFCELWHLTSQKEK